jgi:hypothetical protein
VDRSFGLLLGVAIRWPIAIRIDMITPRLRLTQVPSFVKETKPELIFGLISQAQLNQRSIALHPSGRATQWSAGQLGITTRATTRRRSDRSHNAPSNHCRSIRQ